MKYKFYLCLLVISLLVACKQYKPPVHLSKESETLEEEVSASTNIDSAILPVEYSIIDATAFGLLGKVERVSLTAYSTYEYNGELKDGDELYSKIISFDERGNVTMDEWNNEYDYDAEGKFYRGNHLYTVVQRDKKGRITAYVDDDTQSDYNEADVSFSFIYDKKGRMSRISRGGDAGGWELTLTYERNEIYPTSSKEKSYDEGGGADETNTTYRYTHFDDKGNWTERVCVNSTTELMEEFADDSLYVNTIINESIVVERRTITYYSY